MKPLYLIGYRGSGKTTVARLLAESLGWAWLDADAVLEARAGKSIREIFADDGEPAFRDLEATILRELSGLSDHVIATGGGVILRPENRALLRQGLVVWLDAPAEVLWQRMQADATTTQRRPDLAQGGLAEIEAMLAVRRPLYEECQHYRVDATECPPDQVARSIMQWMPRV